MITRSSALPLKRNFAGPAVFTSATARYQAKALMSPSAPICCGSADCIHPTIVVIGGRFRGQSHLPIAQFWRGGRIERGVGLNGKLLDLVAVDDDLAARRLAVGTLDGQRGNRAVVDLRIAHEGRATDHDPIDQPRAVGQGRAHRHDALPYAMGQVDFLDLGLVFRESDLDGSFRRVGGCRFRPQGRRRRVVSIHLPAPRMRAVDRNTSSLVFGLNVTDFGLLPSNSIFAPASRSSGRICAK